VDKVREFSPEVLFVSLGVDTFDGDPTGSFKLQSADYLPLGAAIAKLRRPTLFVMEGGYAIAALGRNTVNVLRGFEGG
jgi:acetoin utilization deacetylase AcuC-like enzyme